MSEGIVIAMITAAASVFGVWYTSYKGQRELSRVVQLNLEYKDKELEQRLKIIEGKMDKHNNFIQRLTVVETNQQSIIKKLDKLN